MLADKTLLGATLLVTFVSGGAVGYVANDSGDGGNVRPYAVETVFQGELRKLEAEGWTPQMLDEARGAYGEYLDEYKLWWDDFVESHAQNLDNVDQALEQRLDTIRAEHDETPNESAAE